MRLRSLLLAASAAIASLAVAAALALIHISGEASRSASYLVDSVHSVQVAQRLHIELLRLVEDPDAPGAALRYAAIEAHLAAAGRYTQSPEEARIVARVAQAIAAARAELERKDDRHSLHAADAVLGELIDVNLLQAQRAEARAARQSEQAATWAVVGAGALLALAALMLLWLRARLLGPLAELRERMGRAATGEPGVRAGVHSAAELQDLARTFNAMAALFEQQKRDRLELLGRASAQLHEPLSRLRSATFALSTPVPLPQGARQAAQATASLELERLSRILDEWLDAARLEEGTLALSRSPIDCAELLGEAVALFRALSARHRFELSLPPQPLRLEGDGPRLRQVVHNLLGLALHELPAGGPVRVAASRRGLHAVISLHVNVAVELAEPRFAALRKLDDALLGVPGAGLTPAVCKKLIEAHGGQLQIARTGSAALVIEMTLPALPPESLALEPASSRLHLS